jgi:stage II sporulation protein D
VALALVLCLMPAFLVSSLEGAAAEAASEISVLPAGQTAQTLTAAKDRGRAVRLQKTDGETVTLTMEDYLWGVVAAEMPASFAQEALNAQACAARTYTVLRQNAAGEKHSGADICGDSTCCQAWTERSAALERWGLDAAQYSEKISRAVADTDGLGILYEGAPIQALFFSSAPGKTTDAVEVWGNAVDYLKSVDSPEGEEVPNYHSQVTLSPQDVKELTLSAYPGANLSGTPDTWFGTPVRSGTAAVSSVTLGGVTLTGSQVRSLFSLRSAAFSVQYDGEAFVFDVTGYGHGVGMSQYGANAMAQQGSDFREILTWYYTGTQVGELW